MTKPIAAKAAAGRTALVPRMSDAEGSPFDPTMFGMILNLAAKGVGRAPDLNDPLVRAAMCQAGQGIVDMQTGRLGGVGAPVLGPRLVPRGGKGRSADRMLYYVDGEEEFTTGFRESQSLQAQAVLIAKVVEKMMAPIGRIIPTRVLLADVLDNYVKRKTPKPGDNRSKHHTWRTRQTQVRRLREFFPATYLIDIDPDSVELYHEIRGAMDGVGRTPDGARNKVKRSTSEGDVEVLKTACILYKKDANLQFMPNFPDRRPKQPRLAWFTEADMVRFLRAMRGWVLGPDGERYETKLVWDPQGRDYVWDERRRTFRIDDLGRGAWVARPVVDLARKREWAGLTRFVVMGYRTSTRHSPLLRMMWRSDGFAGWVDVQPFEGPRPSIFHRVGPKHEDSCKGQKPLEAGAKLMAFLRCCRKRDEEDGHIYIVRRADGTPYPDAVDRIIKRIVKAAGMDPMKVDAEDRRFLVRDPHRLRGAYVIPKTRNQTEPVEPFIDPVFHVITRHTFAVWGLQRGCSTTEMATAMSCRVETFEGTYGHWTVLATRSARSALDDHETNAENRSRHAAAREPGRLREARARILDALAAKGAGPIR